MLKRLLPVLLFIAFFGCSQQDNVTLEFRIAEDEAGPGLKETFVGNTGKSFFLHQEVLMTEEAVDSAFVAPRGEAFWVELLLTPEGADKFEKLTGENVGKRCAMLVNGELVSAPRIMAPIDMGRAIIAGDFTEEEARTLARVLCRN